MWHRQQKKMKFKFQKQHSWLESEALILDDQRVHGSIPVKKSKNASFVFGDLARIVISATKSGSFLFIDLTFFETRQRLKKTYSLKHTFWRHNFKNGRLEIVEPDEASSSCAQRPHPLPLLAWLATPSP